MKSVAPMTNSSLSKYFVIALIFLTILVVNLKIWDVVATFNDGQRDFKASIVSQIAQLKNESQDEGADANDEHEKARRLLIACSIDEDSHIMVVLLHRVILLLSFMVAGLACVSLVKRR